MQRTKVIKSVKHSHWKAISDEWCKEHGVNQFEIAVVAEWAIATGRWTMQRIDPVKMASEELKSFLKSYKDANNVDIMLYVELEQRWLWADRRIADRDFRQRHIDQEIKKVSGYTERLKKKFATMLTEQADGEEALQLHFPWD